MQPLQPDDPSDLYKTPPPEFGHSMYSLFGFDPKYINLNHGSFGSIPNHVVAAYTSMSAQIESNPDYFLRMGYQPLLTRVRERVAHLIGAETDECVMVQNATLGITTILRNFEWNKGDILIGNNTTYGAISRGLHYLSDVPPHPTVSDFVLNFPTTHAAILNVFRQHLRALPRRHTAGSPKQKIVAVIDSIVSNPGALLPWQEMVQICKEDGVWSIVDGAHSIGQEVGINIRTVQPDFWTSNCHKWLYAKRGAAVLYVPKRSVQLFYSAERLPRHDLGCMPTSYAYVSPSSGLPPTFIEQFEWNGTIDVVPFLSVDAALNFRNYLGGEARINAYCHSLAMAGGKRLAEVMGTSLMDPEGHVTLSMVNVELPLPGSIQPSEQVNMMFQESLLVKWNIYAAHYHHNGRWWTRCSAQVWHEVEDFEKMGKAFINVCREIEDAVRGTEGVGVKSHL